MIERKGLEYYTVPVYLPVHFLYLGNKIPFITAGSRENKYFPRALNFS
jgi:hypothetical protein